MTGRSNPDQETSANGAPARSTVEAREQGELSRARPLALGLVLALALMTAIALICALAGAVGFLLAESGLMAFEQLTSPASVLTFMLVASILLAILLCAAINYTLVSPLRRMTLAMGHLARGDFDFRMQKKERFNPREVDEFAQSFNVAASELASTEMMRAGFISDFSHEFRTPINSLSGFAQLLMDDDLSPDERREYASIIVEESGRLAGLSERILLLSKMEASAILPSTAPVNLAEQIRRTVALLDHKPESNGLSIDLSLDEATVMGNADYLAQLWVNLLDNAIKFSPREGRVSIALYGGRTHEEGRSAAADEVVVWISDEGPGMDSETKSRIFNRFYQGDSSHASKGSGLGLALCKRIVELHGGEIDVQSAPGKGSVFEVRLPKGGCES